MKREMSVNGSFYPDAIDELNRYFEHFDKLESEKNISTKAKAKVVVVPHAGYVYSGFSANLAYKVLKNSNVKNIVVIGPSHREAFNGVSLGDFSSYVTPFGEIQAQLNLANELKRRFGLGFFKEAHKEHSTEVQFPFIKNYLPDAKLVELVYSKTDAKLVSEIIDYVLQDKDNGVIISTDLSHFYNLTDANTLDAICVDAIEHLDIKKLHSGCEACGILGVEAMMLSAKNKSLDFSLLDYRTSADASGDSSRVVGYMSGYFYEKV